MAHRRKDKVSQRTSVWAYRVRGREDGRSYTGTVHLYLDGDSPGSVTAARTIAYRGGRTVTLTGRGTWRSGRLTVSLRPAGRPRPGKANLEAMTPAFTKPRSGAVWITGALSRERKSGRLEARRRLRGGEKVATESWTLQREAKLFHRREQRVQVRAGRWACVPIRIEGAGVVKVALPRTAAPQGLFLPEGDEPAATAALAGEEPFCVNAMASPRPLTGDPEAFSEDGGGAWYRKFTEEEAGQRWNFWFRDNALDTWRLERAVIDQLLFRREFLRICDPWVDIDVHPRVAAPGQEITITVRARAFAGLDIYWWFGSGTGITELDKAHTMSGSGAVFASHTWTVTIDEPGTYTFGANSRDVIYWNNPSIGDGVPHQASEGCGMAYDTVEVRADLRRSYNVGFVLLAPQGTDQSSASFRAELAKIDDIKAALPAQFDTSTLGRAACDASYPTAVLTPPGPIYGLEDGGQMYTFVRQTIRDHFYTEHPDIFDFLAVYEAYPDKTIGSRHLTVRVREAGFGITPYDNSAGWGSGGKLRGVGLVTDVRDLPGTYDFRDSKMHLLLHEVFGHQWGVFANRIGRAGAHFDVGLESPTFTVLYGRPWRKIDATHFTTANVQDPATGFFKVTLHPWILYVAGILTRAEVPETLIDVEPDTPPASRYDLVTTTGTFQHVTLQSVIDQSGDRYDV